MPEHRIILSGLELRPDLSGALYVPEMMALIISDLHLEQGTSLARRGIRVPPFDTAITLKLLETVVKKFKPARLVFLGDTFHDEDGEARIEAPLLERLAAIAAAHETFWISGNHDPLPPQFLNGHAADLVMLGPLALRHEPARKLDGLCEVAGHLHPGCAITQRGRRIAGKCFIADDKRLIMPAFGAYTGALPVTSPAFNGLFDEASAQAWMLGRERIYKFPFARLS